VKRRHVLGEHRRRIALGVDGDEQHLQAVGVLAEFVRHAGQFRERGRTHLRTMHEAEEDRDYLAPEIGERARFAMRVGELKIAPEFGAGKIGELKRRLGRRVAARDQRRQ